MPSRKLRDLLVRLERNCIFSTDFEA